MLPSFKSTLQAAAGIAVAFVAWRMFVRPMAAPLLGRASAL